MQRYLFTAINNWRQCQFTQIHTSLHLRFRIYICANSWIDSLANYASVVMACGITTYIYTICARERVSIYTSGWCCLLICTDNPSFLANLSFSHLISDLKLSTADVSLAVCFLDSSCRAAISALMACITLLRKSCNWSQEILFCWSSEFRLMMEFSSIVRISRIWVGCDNFRF